MSISTRCAASGPAIGSLVIGLLACGAGPAGAQIDHPVFHEVVVQERYHPQIGQIGSPFITIVNPTDDDVDLSDYFISNANDGAAALYYYNIVKAEALDAGGGADSLFHCRFPANVTLAAGDSLVIAINGSTQFADAYDRLPDFELFEDGTAPDAVPEMVPAFPSAIGQGLGVSYAGANTPHLRSQACLVLYHWDGATDLVQDVDYLLWGGLERYRVDKTGVASDGPDDDEALSLYLPDTPVADQEPAAAQWPNPGLALRRDGLTEGNEVASGGNGLTGHDETSENQGSTWQANVQAALPSAPASLSPPAPIILAVQGGSAAAAPNVEVAVTATVAAYDAVAEVTLSYTVDGGAATDLTAADNGDGTWTAVIPGFGEGTEIRWSLAAVAANGALATYPVDAPRFTRDYTVGGPPPPGDHPFKLLFSQVCVRGTAAEFIEIYNPNAQDVDLSRYFLSDAIYTPNNQGYWNITQGTPTRDAVGGGSFGDFHAKFPDGFVLAAGDSIAVAITGAAAFLETYGYLPGLALYDDGQGAGAVPVLEPIFGTSSSDNSVIGPGSEPTLSNGGESAILYYWDGESDLVTDVDVFVWWSTSDSNSFMFTKNGRTIGDSTYLPETVVADQQPIDVEHDYGQAYVRVDATEGEQIASGSNGVGGRDELSEDWITTFAPATAQPTRPADGGAGEIGTAIILNVPARTFVPARGDEFPIEVVTTSGSETKLRIFDLNGRLVLTLYDSRFERPLSVNPEVPSTLVWDGRDETFSLVPGGMYVVHLSVVKATNGREETRTAPVVVATRFD